MDNLHARITGARHAITGPNEESEENLEEGLKQVLVAVAYQLLTGDQILDDAPDSVEEARARIDWQEWESAMREEMNTLEKMGTWRMMDLPTDRKPITCKWVFTLKHDDQGNIIKYKVRLVARGFSQEYGIDYKETFAPVIRLDALRAMLALAAIKNLYVQQMDIKGAYLHGNLEEEIYMLQPPGFEDGTGRVCRLVHSLYGLKQSGRAWYFKLREVLESYGFKQVAIEHCLYIRERNGHTQILSSWIDDLMLFGDDSDDTNEIKELLKKEFEVHDLGEPRLLIGKEILRDHQNQTLILSQKNYIRKIIEKHGMKDANPVSTPMDPNITLLKRETPNTDARSSLLYATAIGSLMYAAVGTRVDIAYAVQNLSQFTQNPGPEHWTAVKRVFRYLKGTTDYGLVYGGRLSWPDRLITAYSDADWGSNPNDQKSITGNTYLLGGAAIGWLSKKQTVTATSSCEAEYVAASACSRHITWLRNMFDGLGYKQETPTQVYCDNQAAISLSHDFQFHARSKHIDIQHHFIRDKVADETIIISYVPTDENPASTLR